MNITLGNLKIIPANEHPELLSTSVANAIATMTNSGDIGVAEIDPALSDTAAFCEHYKISMNQAANCVVLEAKRTDRTWLSACLVLGSTRADINGLARRTLDARRVSFAPMEQAVAQTGMEYGAITPVGLPADWTILIDKAVIDADYIIIGSGIRKSKLVVPGKLLSTLSKAIVLDGLAK